MLALFLGACENPSGEDGNGNAAAAREAADNFYLEHSAVIELPVDMITLATRAPVNAALETYAGLSAEAQALLAEDKAHLDRLKTRLSELADMAEKGAYYIAADLGAHLAAQPDNTADTPYTAVYTGSETPKALYRALAAGGKYVNLNLAESGVQGFNYGVENGRELIVHLTLPDSLTEIRAGENKYPIFNGFTNLKSVDAAGLVKLGSYIFSNRTSLERVDLPKTAVFDNDAFLFCTALTTVEIPQAVTLKGAVFRLCTSLTTVILGETPPAVQTNIFRDTATAGSPKTITFKVPDVSVYTSAGSPWSDKIGANKDVGYYWATQGAGRDYLTVALEAL
jgi:hypothetical protein